MNRLYSTLSLLVLLGHKVSGYTKLCTRSFCSYNQELGSEIPDLRLSVDAESIYNLIMEQESGCCKKQTLFILTHQQYYTMCVRYVRNSYTCRVVGGFSDTLQMASTPVSLQNQCLIYIIRFLELFPVDYLALLPVTVRQRLLENLPPADVCRLEQSKFSEGLDIDGVWKKLSNISDMLPYTHYSSKPAYLSKNGYKDSFFNKLYSFLATKQFETSLDHQRYKIVQCLCTPLRPQTRIRLFATPAANEHVEQRPYWSLLGGNQEFPISTPNRYLPYYQPLPPSLSEIDSIKSIVLLTPTLCHYYPTALDISIHVFINTLLWKLLNFTADSTLSTRYFQQVESLSFTFYVTNDIKKLCHKCIQHILLPARRVLQKFFLQANHIETLGYMLECCIPILQETLQMPQQSPRQTLFPSLCEVTVVLNTVPVKYSPLLVKFSPLSKKHGRLLQHFSTIFSRSQFSSLIIDGIPLQDTSSSQPFGSILHSFLTSSTTHEHRLILRNVTVRSTSLPPPVVTPECSLHYKSLIIEKSVIPNSVINWLLEKGQLHLKTLKLGFKPQWHSTGSPQAAALTQPLIGFKNVHVNTLALHTTQQVRSFIGPRVFAFSYRTFEQILSKPTLKCLDLSYNGLGEDSIVPHLTEALKRRVQTVGTLQELNLAHNHLGYVTDDNLQRLFNAIFSLPQLQELTLNICGNDFNLHHFTTLFICWTKNSSGVKLQYLDYSDNNFRNPNSRFGFTITQQVHNTYQLIEETMAKLAIKCRPARPAALYEQQIYS